ncbi:hypothetical protein VCUG_00950 [Vavraia culicis subsp. floridensis]|uniref:Uncharacterized protein n=1 Tax=Vavraia culicis (isolate floridensis) TaxID=948595 RepID=L2GV71_VAVCU|nr:uncharacterized protein VCUG_00950 [Vavraia culicis subsp. floridensis]ELA47519.1 hypothetical protein VCUG_00950 [Vavraia culicis subsp. floridensis]
MLKILMKRIICLLYLCCIVHCTCFEDEEETRKENIGILANKQHVSKGIYPINTNKNEDTDNNCFELLRSESCARRNGISSEHDQNEIARKKHFPSSQCHTNIDSHVRCALQRKDPSLPHNSIHQLRTRKASVHSFPTYESSTVETNPLHYNQAIDKDEPRESYLRSRRKSIREIEENKITLVTTWKREMAKHNVQSAYRNSYTPSEHLQTDRKGKSGYNKLPTRIGSDGSERNETTSSEEMWEDIIIIDLPSIKFQVCQLKKRFRSYLTANSREKKLQKQTTRFSPPLQQFGNNNSNFIPSPGKVMVYDNDMLSVKILHYIELLLDFMEDFAEEVYYLEDISDPSLSEKDVSIKLLYMVMNMVSKKRISACPKTFDLTTFMSEFESTFDNMCSEFMRSYLRFGSVLSRLHGKQFFPGNERVIDGLQENNQQNGELGVNKNGEMWVKVRKTWRRRLIQRKNSLKQRSDYPRRTILGQRFKRFRHASEQAKKQRHRMDVEFMKSELYQIFKELHRFIGYFRQDFMFHVLPKLKQVCTLLTNRINDLTNDVDVKNSRMYEEDSTYSEKKVDGDTHAGTNHVPFERSKKSLRGYYKILKCRRRNVNVLTIIIVNMINRLNRNIRDIKFHIEQLEAEWEWIDG